MSDTQKDWGIHVHADNTITQLFPRKICFKCKNELSDSDAKATRNKHNVSDNEYICMLCWYGNGEVK